MISVLEIENESLREQNAINTARLTNYAMQVLQHERNITRLETTMEAIEKELQLLAELTADKREGEAVEQGYITLVCPKCGSERLNDIRTAQCLDTACSGIMVKKEES